MALSEELPIFRDTYELLLRLIELKQQLPRLHRYDLGSRMVDYGLNMAELIREANTTREKGPALERFLLCHGNLTMVLRACSDLRIIDSKKHAQLTLLLVRIGKQATAWKNRYSA